MDKVYVVIISNNYPDYKFVDKAFESKKSAEKYCQKKRKENKKYIAKMIEEKEIPYPDEILHYSIEEIEFEE